VAQGLFQHHTGLGCVQPGGAQLLANCGVQGRCRGHIHDDGVGVAVIQTFGQGGVVVRLGQVHAHEFEDGGKARKLFGTGAFGKVYVVKTCANQLAVLFITQVITTDADNAAALG
jgi:hypothetical protein